MVWALALTETISYGVLFYSFAVFVVPMRDVLDASTAALGGALSIALAANGITAIVVGPWLDAHGARALMTAGSLLGAASIVGWSQARTLPQLYLAFIGMGVAGAAVLYEPAFSVVNTWFRRDRAVALLTVTLVAGFAQTVFLPTSQALLDGLGYEHALLVLAALVGACALPHAMLLRRRPSDHGLLPDGADEVAPPEPPTLDQPGAVRAAWRQGAVRWLTAAWLLETVAVTIVAVNLIAYLRDTGVDAGPASWAAGALGILSVTGRIALTSLAARVGLGRLAAWMIAGQSAGVAALFVLPRPVSLVAFVLLFGAGVGVMTIARAALLGGYVPATVFASVSGRQAFVANGGRVLAPVLGGLAISSFGYGPAFTVVAACTLLAGLALLAAERAAQPKRPLM